jgi:hypothetical protein
VIERSEGRWFLGLMWRNVLSSQTDVKREFDVKIWWRIRDRDGIEVPRSTSQAQNHVCLTKFRSRINLVEILSLEPREESPSGLLRCPTPHAVCGSQEPGSHRPPFPVDGAMQGQNRFRRGL